jgi:uncharacterized protein
MGVVAALWRYPVKSMAGERLTEAAVGERGLDGDRLYAVRDPAGKFGSGKNTRRFGWHPPACTRSPRGTTATSR